MVALHKYKNKKIAIYGIGKTGLSVIKILKKLKIKFVCWDDDKEKLNGLTYNFDKFWIKKDYIDYIIISPGIDINKCKLKNYLKKNSNKIITDLDLFFELNKKTNIIAITGTNGKSTTCKILEKLLKTAKYKVQTVGNIGKPILSLNVIKNNFFIILEVSSYQLQYSKIFRSKYAAILNISPDHLERHSSIKNYVYAKFKLIKNQSKKDFAYINFQNEYLTKAIKTNKVFSKIIDVNLEILNKFKKKITNPYFLTKSNQENLSFIFSISKKLNLKNKKILQTINTFKGLKFRQEIIYNSNKVTCINDSKATSFASSINILKSLQKVFWIVGGIPKLGDKFMLKKNECKNICVYIFGKNKNFFVKQFKNKLPFYCFKDLKSAIQKVLKDIKIKNKNNLHKTILFSPSAASFDSFKNIEERGDYFNFLLKKLKIKKTINAIQ